MNAIAADMCTNARRVVRKSWMPKLKLLTVDNDGPPFPPFMGDPSKMEADLMGGGVGGAGGGGETPYEPGTHESEGGAQGEGLQ